MCHKTLTSNKSKFAQNRDAVEQEKLHLDNKHTFGEKAKLTIFGTFQYKMSSSFLSSKISEASQS